MPSENEQILKLKKKVKFLIGGIVFFISLSINFIISSNSEETILYFDNINAIAEKESGDDFTPTCIKAGYLCTGIDKNGNIGTFDGLSIDMD